MQIRTYYVLLFKWVRYIFQIVPKCFNYGKSILSNEQFIEEWKKRNFKTDFTNCSIKLPENYLTDCYFNNLIYIKITD